MVYEVVSLRRVLSDAYEAKAAFESDPVIFRGDRQLSGFGGAFVSSGYA